MNDDKDQPNGAPPNGPSETDSSLALFTDLYELTMGQAYWQSGTTAQATFSLYFRSYPPDRGYFVLAGVEEVLEHLGGFRFSAEDVEFLDSTGKLDRGFVEYLARLRFSGSVRAMPEGAVFFANEPVAEVTAPVIEAQVLETFLLNRINIQSLLATKASRVVHAARGKTVVDFGARRTQGIDAANRLARVAHMAGFAGTSNMLAAKRFGIPTFGSMAHSFVQCFPSEEESFRAYARSFPDTSTLLVDTYDTLGGVRKAIGVGKELRHQGRSLRSIRLDSGDLRELSTMSRALLDEAGLNDVQIFASGGLDEFEIDALLSGGASIDGFGVGTNVGVSSDAPSADSVYKLVQYDGRPTLKLSSGKGTLPGPKQVYRYRGEDGAYLRDVIALAHEPPPDGEAEPLLAEVMRDGKRLGRASTLQRAREYFAEEFGRLPDRHKALRSPPRYPVGVSAGLERLRRALTKEAST